MKAYREFQFSWLMVAILVAVHVVVSVAYVFELGNNPMSSQGFVLMTGVFLIILLTFYGMQTTVSEGDIRLKLGVGIITKKIALETVAGAEVVKTPWYYGYGIRWIPNGWLYNVSGVYAVELRFRERKGIVRIGTKHPQRLREAIQLQVATH